MEVTIESTINSLLQNDIGIYQQINLKTENNYYNVIITLERITICMSFITNVCNIMM